MIEEWLLTQLILPDPKLEKKIFGKSRADERSIRQGHAYRVTVNTLLCGQSMRFDDKYQLESSMTPFYDSNPAGKPLS